MSKVKVKRRSKKLSEALSYAQKGRLVFPVHTVVDGVCSCGKENCGSPGKHPMITGWQDKATTDEKQIEEWFEEWPDANIAIRTGVESGLVVLDVDPDHGGMESLSALTKEHGRLPETPRVKSGGGGLHVYFNHPGGKVKCRQGFHGPGLDIRGDGGYIIAPPSLHESGEFYEWMDGASPDDLELAEMPDYLLKEKSKKSAKTTSNATDDIPEGQRDTRLFEIAASLHNKGLGESEILAVLLDINANRCRPPLDDSQVRKIVVSACSYPPNEENNSQATELVKHAEQAELFHNPDKQCFAAIDVDGHKECWPLDSKAFEDWLQGQYYRSTGKAAGSQAFQSALGVLRCKANFDGEEENIFVRVAGLESKIVIDLGDPQWSSVEVTENGWKLCKNHPVRFIRSKTLRPLPVPVAGGDLNELRDFLNLDSDNDWILLVAWLVGTLQPNGPYPLLVVSGEQGSAKSTVCRVLRSLVDPQQPALRSQPKDERDLMISASRSWILAYDNLSKISPKMSDALCRLATGGGYATRQLFSDNEECVFDCKRPVILNGISEIANRSDLLDRSISISLPPIPKSKRLPESEYMKKLDELRPRIFGALLDVAASILKRLDSVKLDEFPRMADFARWATAAEPALGLESGAILRAYDQKQEIYHHDVVESSAIGPAIIKLINKHDEWKGTAGDLLNTLTADYRFLYIRRKVDWPRSALGMRNALQRLAPNLRAVGIEYAPSVKQGRSGDRILTLKKIIEIPPALPAPPVQEPKKRRIKVKKVKRKPQ